MKRVMNPEVIWLSGIRFSLLGGLVTINGWQGSSSAAQIVLFLKHLLEISTCKQSYRRLHHPLNLWLRLSLILLTMTFTSLCLIGCKLKSETKQEPITYPNDGVGIRIGLWERELSADIVLLFDQSGSMSKGKYPADLIGWCMDVLEGRNCR